MAGERSAERQGEMFGSSLRAVGSDLAEAKRVQRQYQQERPICPVHARRWK